MRGVVLLAASIAAVACGRVGFDDRPPGDGRMSDGAQDSPSGSGIRFIQSTAILDGAVLSASAAMPMAVTAGDLLIAGWSLDGPPPTQPMITDSLGTVLTTVSTGVAAPLVVYLAEGFARSTGVDTFTIDVNSSPNTYLELQAWEFAGLKANGFVAAAQAQGQSTAVNAAATPLIAVGGSGSDLLFAWGVFVANGTSAPASRRSATPTATRRKTGS